MDPTEGVLQRVETLGQMFGQRFCSAVGPRMAVIGRQVPLTGAGNVPGGSGCSVCSRGDGGLKLCLTNRSVVVLPPQRFTLGVRQYYKVMESMLKSASIYYYYYCGGFSLAFSIMSIIRYYSHAVSSE